MAGYSARGMSMSVQLCMSARLRTQQEDEYECTAMYECTATYSAGG